MWASTASLRLPPLRTRFSRGAAVPLQGSGQGSGRPSPAAAASLAGGSMAVCQGWQPALAAACSMRRKWISSSCLTRHRSLQGLKAGRRLICGENAASAWGRKPFLKHKLPPHPLQVLSLATRVKVFHPLLLLTPHDFLIFSPPPKDREGSCLWDKSVLKCGVLQEEGISITSCPLEDHCPPQSATENPSLYAVTCHLPSPLPHYTKI